MQKEILVTKDVLEQLEKKQIPIQGIICLEQEVDFDLYCSEELYDIDVPIITVTGAGENCEKFDLQLAVRKIFIEQNYKVFQVGTKDYSTLFELDNWPRFLFSQEISFPKKVFAFNRWIFERVKKLEPDIIILGIPGGIMPINNKICNYFGELALIISKALKIDVNILSLYFNKNINHELLKSYQDYCQFALNFPTNYFNISSNYFKYDEEKNEYKIEIFHMDSEYVKKEFPENNHAEFYVFNNSYKIGALLSSDNILKEFIDNIEVV